MRHGEWPSLLSIDDVLTANDGMHQVRAVGDDVYWLANIASENGRGTIMRVRGGEISELTPDANVRARVNEYGGGTYDVNEHALAYSDDLTKTIYLAPHEGATRTLTSGDERLRYAGLRLASDINALFAVREDHRSDGEPITTLVRLSLDSSNPDGGEVIASGADFYARPAYVRGRIAWAQWNHPNMPWDSCEIWTARVGEPGRKVAGGPGVSAVNPLFLHDGRLAWLDDSSGYWNITLDDGTRITDPHDYCPAPWTLEESPYAQLDASTLVSTRFVDGAGELVTVDLTTKRIDALDLSASDVESISCSHGHAYAVINWPDRPTSLVRVTGRDAVDLATTGSGSAATLPRPLWCDGPSGRTHAWFYPVPAHEGERPPLLVKCHGGPTGMSRSVYDLEAQFWTDRGVAVLDVNYSGSAGFGRAYRERLAGRWGVLDVADCEAAVRAVADAGLVDPAKVAIIGGSAGGYTVLQALVTSDVFGAGISKYGIGDLEMLATDTHKFESRYLDGLVGPYPEAREVYVARSPIHHVDALSTPMLILQGRDDAVVPLNQAESMADAVRAKGLPVALMVFDGEGHGFRIVENRRAALLAQLSFLGQVFGFTPTGDVPTIQIENLPGSGASAEDRRADPNAG